MKKLIVLSLICLFIYGCFNDCTPKNVKVGETLLLPSTKAWLLNLVDKTAIFKDSLGNEMQFKSIEKIKIDTQQNFVRINCNSGWKSEQKSMDFEESDGLSLKMVSGDSLDIYYKMSVMSLNIDAVDAQIGINNDSSLCGGNSGWVIYKDRGKKMTFPVEEKFRTILDTVINGKSFKNILGRWRKDNDLCCCGLKSPSNTPYEVFFDRQKGIVGFKQLNGKTWTLDRIE